MPPPRRAPSCPPTPRPHRPRWSTPSRAGRSARTWCTTRRGRWRQRGQRGGDVLVGRVQPAVEDAGRFPLGADHRERSRGVERPLHPAGHGHVGQVDDVIRVGRGDERRVQVGRGHAGVGQVGTGGPTGVEPQHHLPRADRRARSGRDPWGARRCRSGPPGWPRRAAPVQPSVGGGLPGLGGLDGLGGPVTGGVYRLFGWARRAVPPDPDPVTPSSLANFSFCW